MGWVECRGRGFATFLGRRGFMKLRPVVLVLVLLAGFYYLTTRGAATRALLPWAHGSSRPVSLLDVLDRAEDHAVDRSVSGPLGSFELTESAAAAPAFDTEDIT